jgi:pantoate--beta-alanine ligase
MPLSEIDTTTYSLPLARTVSALRAQVAQWRAEGARIAFVPTMGALHAGHLSLVELAAAKAERVVVSVFVNPGQFAPNEDFDAYPRTEPDDAEKLAETPAALLYAPNAREMYPEGFATTVSLAGPALDLETNFRPHFFDGVATVVAKLLIQVGPDIAVFGEKDYQQLLVVKRLAADLDLPVEILSGPTVREADGLALSSRNAYLSPEDRQTAVKLAEVIHRMARNLEAGARISPEVEQGKHVLYQAGFNPVDYLEVRDAETLERIDRIARPARILVAARLGTTRLIDNCAVAPPT